jgi:hypothetical protein
MAAFGWSASLRPESEEESARGIPFSSGFAVVAAGARLCSKFSPASRSLVIPRHGAANHGRRRLAVQTTAKDPKENQYMAAEIAIRSAVPISNLPGSRPNAISKAMFVN